MDNYTVTFEPGNHKILVCEGSSVKEVIATAGLDFDFPCGGRGTCGKCRVKVLEKNLNPTEKELKYLDKKEILEGIHLACEIKIYDDITIQLNTAKEQVHNILHYAAERAFNIEPLLKKVYIEVDLPSLHDQKSDLKRLKEKLLIQNINYKNLKISVPVLKDLPVSLRESQHNITVVINEDEILGIEKGNSTEKM